MVQFTSEKWDGHFFTGHPILKLDNHHTVGYMCMSIHFIYYCRWINKDWSSCSGTQCGIGYQYTVAECHVMQANGRDQKVSDELCDNVTRPDAERECVRIDSSSCGTVWKVGSWGKVSGKEGGREVGWWKE